MPHSPTSIAFYNQWNQSLFLSAHAGSFLVCICNSLKPTANPEVKLTSDTALGVIEQMKYLEINSGRMKERPVWDKDVSRVRAVFIEANTTSFF